MRCIVGKLGIGGLPRWGTWMCQKDYARVISARDQSGCHWSRFGANVGEVGLGTGSEWYRCSRTRPVRSSQALCDIELSELKKRD